jgi:DNA-binding transcriptional LysR family regulator
MFDSIIMNADHAQLDANLLVALYVFLEERSVTKAAERLAITQSAASHKLKKLREALGDPLLVGTRGDLGLTARAEAIRAPLAGAVVSLRAAVKAGEPFVPGAAKRVFTIATVDYGEFWTVPSVVAALVREAPSVSIRIETPGRDVFEQLAKGDVDVLVGPKVASPAVFRRLRVARDPFIVAAREGHPALGRKLTLERYLAHGHIAISARGPKSATDAWLEAHGHVRHVVLRTPNFVSAPFHAARTDLLLTAPAGLIAAARGFTPLATRPVPFPLPVTHLHMHWHERVQRDPGHMWFRGLVERTIREVARVR